MIWPEPKGDRLSDSVPIRSNEESKGFIACASIIAVKLMYAGLSSPPTGLSLMF
jgi:hypothetical protein